VSVYLSRPDLLRVAIAGLGQLGGDIAKSVVNFPALKLVAAADPRDGARTAFEATYGGRAYPTVKGLCTDPDVDAVFIATPSALHCEHVVMLAEHGKHVVLTKPMALTLEECDQMIEAVERKGVVLVYGTGGMPFRPSYLAMRRIIESGRLGRLRAITHFAFSDWMLRPREPHEVQVDGGLLLNQGPHAVDAIRLLGGGMVRSLRGATVDMDLQGRPCAGFLSAFLEFQDGTPATLLYNGYGYLFGWEFTPWADESSRLAALANSYKFRRQLRGGKTNDSQIKEQSRFGASEAADFRIQRGQGIAQAEGWLPSDDGTIIVHCERGAIRQSATGLWVYDDEGRHDEPLPPEAGASPEANEIQELLRGIAGGPVFRNGRWGKATLEVVLALAQSSDTRQEVLMKHQVPVPVGI
jgi:phthalate 4,5-cis-dihydrodiol dehydrogenase